MVVCKYFLQGTCKFGTYCNFEHQTPSGYTNFSENNRQSASILRQANFGSAQVPNTKPLGSSGNVDVNTLVKSVVNDMIGAEKGGQWILSCYAPFKEKPAFPGFDDQSPEEIRLGFYEAQNNGTVEPYKAQLQALLQSTIMKIKALQNPAQDLVAVLQNIYNTPPSSCSGTYGQNVVTASTPSLNQQSTFTLQSQNKSVFGQSNDNIFKTNSQPMTTNIFGSGSPQNNFSGWQQNQGQANIFGPVPSSSPPNQNIFGGNTYSKPQNSIFVSQQGSNIFANSGQTPSSSSNIFTPQALPVSPPSSIFGATQLAQQQQPTNIFASTEPTNQNLFSPHPAKQQSLFLQQPGQQPQQNIFATQNPPQNIQTQNIFSMQNQNQPQPNIFSANTNTTQFSNTQLTVQSTPPSYSSSIFGYNANLNPSMGVGATTQQPVDETIYSKLEEITEEERKWYESDTLDIMDIPDKPPTYDMCFKV